jgi:hypothetical protein
VCLSLSSKKILVIPLNKMAEGADLCLENAVQFCSDAKVLIEKSSYEHALGFCIFAIEEFGKSLLLKSTAAYAQKEAKADVYLNKEKPENFFHMTAEDLKTMGFKSRKGILQEVNPFYDHLSKLLMASNLMNMSIHTNVVKSIEGKEYESVKAIEETIANLTKEAYKIDVYHTDLRELALYVDYDQEHRVWKKGKLELTQEKLRQLVANIELAIGLAANG